MRISPPQTKAEEADMQQKDSLPPYVLITPARNEETFIEKTLQSVAQQTFLPAKWVIVNDGSTDRTGEIVAGYAVKDGWIAFVRRHVRSGRDFAAENNGS